MSTSPNDALFERFLDADRYPNDGRGLPDIDLNYDTGQRDAVRDFVGSHFSSVDQGEDWRGYAVARDDEGNLRDPELYARLLDEDRSYVFDVPVLVGDAVEFVRDGESHVGTVTSMSGGFATVATDRNYFSDVPTTGMSLA